MNRIVVALVLEHGETGWDVEDENANEEEDVVPKLIVFGFLKRVFAPVSVYSAELPCQTSSSPSPPVV